MANIRNDSLGTAIRTKLNSLIKNLEKDGLTESRSFAAVIKRIATATRGGSETSGSGGDVLNPGTVRQVIAGSIKNPSLNMLEAISEVLNIPISRLTRFSEEEN
jgi:transcriptional regulator with XRE-family HTH domain